jgi:hypothetical protein
MRQVPGILDGLGSLRGLETRFLGASGQTDARWFGFVAKPLQGVGIAISLFPLKNLLPRPARPAGFLIWLSIWRGYQVGSARAGSLRLFREGKRKEGVGLPSVLPGSLTRNLVVLLEGGNPVWGIGICPITTSTVVALEPASPPVHVRCLETRCQSAPK